MSIRKVKTKNGDKWEAYFWVQGRGSKRIRRRFDRKIDAQNFYESYLKKQDELLQSNASVNDPDAVTLEAEADFWLENSKMRFSAGHQTRAEGILRKILPDMGKLTLDQIGPTLLTNMQKTLLKQGLKNSTVNRYTEVITAIVNHSHQHRRISYNPTIGFKKLPVATQEMKFWEKGEAESFLNYASERYPQGSEYRWVYVSYLLALNTGLRAGEIWGLQVCDLVEDGHTLFIRRQFNRVSKTFELPKGKKRSKRGRTSRHVPCNSHLKSELEALIKTHRLKKDDLFFKSKVGRPICHDAFAERFERDQKRWGGKQIRFHDMRHTAITQLISAGVDLKTVQSICGHEDISTTMGYTHLIGDNIKRVADVFSLGGASDTPRKSEAPKLKLISGDEFG